MTAGRGFIAIALVIFAKWNPLWAIAGALLFGGAEGLQLQPARALVIKTKQMYLFMNMLFQHTVIKRPKTPSPTQGNFVPRDYEEDFNHPTDKVEDEV